MTEAAIMRIADDADMIVNGYAFTRNEKGYRVLNLKQPGKACVISPDGAVLETSMDDIELQIVAEYFSCNRRFLEEDDA